MRLVFICTGLLPLAVQAHVAFWHPSMYGFNVTDKTFPYDNRPVTPHAGATFKEWWAHNHIDYPPHPGDLFELTAGKVSTAELACHKGATTYWESSEGGDIRKGNDPCPGPNSNDPNRIHTTGLDNVKGCALAIGPSHISDIHDLKPEQLTIFSVNHRCVWDRFTDFPVPENMPPCTGPGGHCICAWFWIHSPQSGGEQIFMNAFNCHVTPGPKPKSLQTPKVARRCGEDPEIGRPANPANCTIGAKQPLYWLQEEGNNMFEDYYTPPYYNDLYGFSNGAQNSIFIETVAAPSLVTAQPTNAPEPDFPNGIPMNVNINGSTIPRRTCSHRKRSLPPVRRHNLVSLARVVRRQFKRRLTW